MVEVNPHYVSYLLRLWPVEDNGSTSWRASLENSQTRERVGFVSVDQLCAFLIERFSETDTLLPGQAKVRNVDR